MTLIRPEQPDDLPWIHAINTLAFGQPDEAMLVDQLRDDGDVLASLVAVGDGDEIDGHILFSGLDLLFDDGTSARVAALAPVAVRPDQQRQGIGKELVRAGIAACQAQGLGAIIVLGHPEYYPQFGFSAALAQSLRSPFPGDAFMALELIPDMLRGKRGAVRYAKAFGLPVIEEPCMNFDTIPSLPRLFLDQAQALSGKPFLSRKVDGAFKSIAWSKVAADVRALARGLIALGVQPGDRVALIAENRPEWLISDLAIMSVGAITVPAFSTNTIEDNRHVLTHSGSRGLIISGPSIAKRALSAALQAPEIGFVIAMEPLGTHQQLPLRVVAWDEALHMGDGRLDAEIDARIGALARGETCCIIYTSGTGGVPKGVMLTHGSILCNIKGAYRLLVEVGMGNDVFLSFLPLSHSYEHTAGQFLPISIGAQIYYAESIDKLTENMAEARPTIMTAVPRLYEAMHQRIQRGLVKAKPFQRRMFDLAYRLGRKNYEHPGTLTFQEKALNLVCDLLVRRKVGKRFGGRLKAFVSGGAALNYEIGVFFLALGVPLLQGYGQTEASPVISANRPKKIKIDTVGPIFDGLECRIADDGEILVRGEAIMKGYWRDPEATSRAIGDGWLYTGDIGEFDSDGYLKITDRKKDIIVLSGGDNVSPARVEGFLVLQPEIAQAMVHGDRQSHVVALLVPDADFAKDWGAKNGVEGELAALADNAAFQKILSAAIDRVNANLSGIERIRRFAVLPEGFTIDNAMLTPSMKIRRHKIRERWGDVIAKLY